MNDAASDPPDLAHADIGIVTAMAMELAPFLERCEKVKKYTGGDFVFRGGRFEGIRIAVVEGGLGFAQSRRATQALIQAHSPKWVLSSGFSGALRPEMKPGHIVIADSICDTHGQHLDVPMQMPEDREHGLYVGRFLTVDEMIRHVADKERLAQEYDAIACDMESLAVAQVCRDEKTRFLAVRSISDDLSADLPPEVLSLVGASGSMRVGAALGAIWKRPGSMKDMWHLRETAHRAADRLAMFLEGVVEQLYANLH